MDIFEELKGDACMAKFCMNCGTKLEADDRFCPSCGTAVEEMDTSENAGELANSQQQMTPTTTSVNSASVMSRPQNGQQKDSSVPRVSANGLMNGKTIAAIAAIAVVAMVGVFLYHGNDTSTPSQKMETVAKTSSSNVQAQQNAAQDRHKRHQQAYLKAAAERLEQNEETLAKLAKAINSGKYSTGDLLAMVKKTFVSLNDNKNAVVEMQHTEDDNAAMISRLFDLQGMRAVCMEQGVKGDTNQYAVGGKYYDEFQEKFAAFKKANNL